MIKENRIKILMIEDDQLLVKMYQTKFSAEGFDVEVVTDGEKGYKMAITGNPNVIVLDLMMPKMSGMEILKKLHAQGSKVPVIILTNLSQEEERKKVFEFGAKEYLVKADLTPSQVIQKIKQHL